MKNKNTALIAVGLSLIFTLPIIAKVRESTRSHSTGIAGLECRVTKVETDYKKDGSGDWVKPYEKYEFRSTGGERFKLVVDMDRSSFTNCKLSPSYPLIADKYGNWSGSWNIESIDGSAYSYNLRWRSAE